MITYTRLPHLDVMRQSRDTLSRIGVVALFDTATNTVTWYNPRGNIWQHNIDLELEGSPLNAGFTCLSDFLDMFSYETCSQREALELLVSLGFNPQISTKELT